MTGSPPSCRVISCPGWPSGGTTTSTAIGSCVSARQAEKTSKQQGGNAAKGRESKAGAQALICIGGPLSASARAVPGSSNGSKAPSGSPSVSALSASSAAMGIMTVSWV